MGISKPDTVLNTLDSLSLKGGNVVDDCCDKLISHVFVYVLILFAVIAGIHEYSGTTINCLPHSKDGKVTDDMVKHLNRFCVTQTLYYYNDFWKPTQLPPVNGPSGHSTSPATTLPAPASSNTSSSSSSSTHAAAQPHRQESGRAKRSTLERSFFATGRSEATSGSGSDSQATSVSEGTTTSKSSGSSESASVSASSSEVSRSASTVSETTEEATTERSSASVTSTVSGKEESSQTASTVTQAPATSPKEAGATTEGATSSQTQTIQSTPQKSTATTSFPVGGQKTGSTTPTTSGNKATTEKDQKVMCSTPATSVTKTSATAGHQASTTQNSATDLHPMTSQHVHTMGGETLYANEITHMITVVFVLQAIILKLPQILWKELLEKTGTNLQTLITRLMDEQFEDPAKREMTIKKFACNLPKAVKSDTAGLLQRKGWRRGQKLITFFQSNIFWLYVSIKLLYIVVLVFQGWLLSTFFAFNFRDFGVSVITKEILKQPINYVTDFPTVVLCNFRSPTLEMPWEGVWVQCVLVFNNFLQNMLLIEWLGILILSLVMVLSICNWVYWRWSEQSNIAFIHNLLSANLHTSLPPSPGQELKDVVHGAEAAQQSSPGSLEEALDWEQELRDGDKLGRFVDDFLGADGMFLLRIIKANTNRVVMSELTTQLYRLFVIFDAGRGQ